MAKTNLVECLGYELPVIIDALTEAGLRKILSSANKNERAELMSRLNDYGSSNQERKINVRMHLLGCKDCRERYLLYLDRRAEKALGWAGSEHKKTSDKYLAVVISDVGYREIVGGFDVIRLLPCLKQS